MLSFDDAPDTAGMSPALLEFAGASAFKNDRLVSFVPFIVGYVLLHYLAALYDVC